MNTKAQRTKLSHSRPKTVNREAELAARPAVGSGVLLGHRKGKTLCRFWMEKGIKSKTTKLVFNRPKQISVRLTADECVGLVSLISSHLKSQFQ
jgi:hypothetical protein